MKRSKNFEKRKKFIMELLGDPLYKPMRLREIASLLQLDKSEKKELFDVLDQLKTMECECRMLFLEASPASP